MLCYAVKLGKYCIQVEQATDRIPIELITGDVFVKFRQGVQSFEFWHPDRDRVTAGYEHVWKIALSDGLRYAMLC